MIVAKRFKKQAERSWLQNLSKHNCTSLSNYQQGVSVQQYCASLLESSIITVHVHIYEDLLCNNLQQQ